MPQESYIRLTRSRSHHLPVLSSERSSLWLGGDHLLLVINSGSQESYKRFYFRDIQSLQMRRREHWKYYGLVTGLLTAGCAAFALSADDPTTAWVFGGLSGLGLAVFVLNLVLGPSCAVLIRTAVQTERIYPLSRWGKTLKVLARIRPFIAATQGELGREEIAALVQRLDAGARSDVIDDPNAPPRML